MSSSSPKTRSRGRGGVDGADAASRRASLSGSEYLQQVLGDVLARALSSVARERPDDPVQYVADYLYKVSLHPTPRRKHAIRSSSRSKEKSWRALKVQRSIGIPRRHAYIWSCIQ